MPITNIFGRMPLEHVWVERSSRQRRDPDPEAGGLLQSIALRGVICPVILEEVPDEQGYHILYAGERRYAASLMLGLSDIPFRFANSPSQSEVQIIEFEENAKRKDLSWQETLQSVVRLHSLFRDEDPECTFEATGVALGWGDGSTVAKYHFIAGFWQDDAVRACNTVNEAYNLLQRRQKRAQATKLEEWLEGVAPGEASGEASGEATETNLEGDFSHDGPGDNSDRGGVGVDSGVSGVCGGGTSTSGVSTGQVGVRTSAGAKATPGFAPVALAPTLPVLKEDFLEWATTYSGPRFNLVHCDFPYGINLGTSGHKHGSNALHREEGELYHDSEDHYGALLEAFVANFDRFAAESCHVMFWYSNREETEVAMRAALRKIPGFAFLRFPLVWHKSDNAGFITPGTPRHIYETCLVGGRGDRPIVKYVSDVYSSPSDNSLHMSAKPEPMLKYFMGMFCDEHSRVLDPTCGSASALRAAEALKAEKVLGLETNPEMVKVANTALLQARALRRASQAGEATTKVLATKVSA